MASRRTASRSAALGFAALLLGGCGGGGGGSAPHMLPSVKPAGTGNVAFSITVPPDGKTSTGLQRAKVSSRSPQFVSPATKSLSIAVAGIVTNVDVTNGAPGCTTNYTTPSISEIAVGSEPRGMTIGPDGNPWFVEDNGEAIGTIKPGNL